MTDIDARTQLASLGDDCAALAAAAAAAAQGAAGLDAEIPSCPGWTMGRLVGHTGKFLQVVAASVRAAPGEPLGRASGPGDADPVTWFTLRTDDLLAALDEADLDAPAPTWLGERTNRFWLRRAANETAIHRWDAQLAHGTPTPVHPALAVDGVDEFLEILLPGGLEVEHRAGGPASLHLHATDVDDGSGEWSLVFGGGDVTWSHAHEKGDAAIRGTASELILFIWGRVRPDDLDVFGDVDVARRWQAATAV